MANELIIYTTPPDAQVTLKLDLGDTIVGVPGTYNGRSDGHRLQIPSGAAQQGSDLKITHEGYQEFFNRGLLVPGGAANPSVFFLDDVHLVVLPEAPPPEPPPIDPGTPSPSTPLEVINGVYATGQFNLATKTGCGQFTEECCRQLAALWGGPPWGHVAKAAGQNQYNAHAVDAVHSLYGSDHGIWDIITSSVSTSARPAFNRAGDSNPEIWRPPAPLPCQPAGATTRDVQFTLTVSLEEFLRLLAMLRVV